MKALRFFSLLCSLLLCVSCEQSECLNDAESPVSRALINDEYTYFQNIAYPGNNSISGDIYCSNEIDYSFTIGFQANVGANCKVKIGDTVMNVVANAVKKFTVKLPAGTTHCSVEIDTSGVSEQAYARLVIDNIGSTSGTHEGYGDLTVTYTK